MFGMRPQRRNETKLYETLGVGKSAGADEIRKAYRKLAIKNHPDKGGDPEKVSDKCEYLLQYCNSSTFNSILPNRCRIYNKNLYWNPTRKWL